MTPKERAAMQQALEALEELFHSNSTKVAVEKYNIAHNALQESLAEPQVDWYEEAMRLAGLNAKNVGELRKLEAEQAEQEPVAWIKLNEDGVYIEDVTGFPVYAAPVQQVDLTDDEIERALDAAKVPELPDGYKSVDLEIARAVIAADREKNK